MPAGSSALTTVEIEQYYARVQAALAGLAPEIREELLDDLPDHLAEVSAEVAADGDGSLQDRLGAPEAYAEELRAAAGIEPPDPGPAGSGRVERVATLARSVAGHADRLDLQAARLVGYPRFTDLLRAVRPGWWVLRGWVVAQFLSGTHDRASWNGFVPKVGGNSLFGLVLTLVAIAASVWLGRRSIAWSRWPNRIMLAASVGIAFWGALVLAHNIGGTAYAYSNPQEGYTPPYSNVSDVYVYDSNGKLVSGARLFDQNGNAIQLGYPQCDSSINDGTTPLSYPLCPNNPGPFRAGPGTLASAGADGKVTSPVPSDSASGASTSPSPASTAPSPTPTAKATPPAKKPSVKATAKATPTR